MKKNILVLFGGKSPEYGVSLQSAYAVITHMDKERYEPVLTGIDRRGNWHLFTGDPEWIREDTWLREDCTVPVILPLDHDAVHCLTAVKEDSWEMIPVDAAFPVMHGAYGEDGRLQGSLEMAGIPVIGCGMTASAVCMDKLMAHRIAASAGIRTARGVTVYGYNEETEHKAEAVGYPLYVKPLRAGSSYGIHRVSAKEQLRDAVLDALHYDDAVLLEEEIRGTECGCAVLGNRQLMTGVPDRIRLASSWYDYAEKYAPVSSEILCPADFDTEMTQKITAAAKTIYEVLGCKGFARVDLFVTEEGELYFNEVNTIPGFTAHSRFPKMMQAAGIGFGELITILIEEELG
ncbi:MAG: D-alanine--D-alanine ligase [Solobacterium sp.]|nr:D-alanine--D-alanine ligase [Solobacterium sp.]